jgi:aldehyde:ferredoxin oxidoreductase
LLFQTVKSCRKKSSNRTGSPRERKRRSLMDKILRIDVGAEGGPKATVEDTGRYATLGGRAMTSTVVWEEVPADCDPLGPLNKLVISPGIMSGSPATTSGRLSVGCKSPLTGGIKEANSGGEASHYLARLGYAAVIFEGERQGDDLYKVLINKDGVTFTPCNDLKMQGNYAVAEKIQAEHGDKVSMLSVGPAGEQGLANSTIAVSDREFRPTRHAARGGPGAVLGSKGIKVIVVDPAGTSRREPADPEAFSAANNKLVEALRASEFTGQGLPAYGTAMIGELINEMGGYPALGAKQGQWERIEKISGPVLAALENQRGGEGAATRGCHTGCIIRDPKKRPDYRGSGCRPRVRAHQRGAERPMIHYSTMVDSPSTATTTCPCASHCPSLGAEPDATGNTL